MTWPIKKGDLDPTYSGQLLVNGLPVDLTGRTVQFIMKDAAGVLKVNAAATITDAVNGRIEYRWVSGDTDTPGTYRVEWEVTTAGKRRTFPPRDYLYIEVVGDLGDAP